MTLAPNVSTARPTPN